MSKLTENSPASNAVESTTSTFTFLPLQSLGSNKIPSCISTFEAQPSYKVSTKSLVWWRNCTYMVSTCKTLKLDYLPMEPLESNYITFMHIYIWCTTHKISSKSLELLRRNCTYKKCGETDRWGDSFITPKLCLWKDFIQIVFLPIRGCACLQGSSSLMSLQVETKNIIHPSFWIFIKAGLNIKTS